MWSDRGATSAKVDRDNALAQVAGQKTPQVEHRVGALADELVESCKFFVFGSIVLDCAQHWVAHLPPMAPTMGFACCFRAEG